jgi:N-acetylneuraminate synthase
MFGIIGSKTLFSARGGEKIPVKAEDPTIAFAFASVVAIKNIEKGEILTEDNIWLKRPGGGAFTAKDYDNLIGKKVVEDISNGTRLKKEHLA